MRTRGSLLALAVTVGLLVLSASGPEAGALGSASPVRIDLTASAHPRLPLGPHTDLAFHVDAVAGVTATSATTATASAACVGCRGEAVSVQVLYVDRAPTGNLDNAAIAWAQSCVACDAVAVSVQVVRVSDTDILWPTNRALAVTAACTACGATSAAYQLVVAGSSLARLSPLTLRGLVAWASERAQQLHEASDAGTALRRVRVVQARSLQSLADRVNTELGSATVAARTRLAMGAPH
jgi:hypothetical protein